jgi:hypothetical protein
MHLYHYAGNNPVKYTDPDGNYLAIKDRWQQFMQNISIAALNGNRDPVNTAINVEKQSLESESFKANALTVARDKLGLGKNTQQSIGYADAEQGRYEALVKIAEDTGDINGINSMLLDAGREYENGKKAALGTFENGRWKRPTEEQKNHEGEKAANKRIDEFIKIRMPSYGE